MDIQLKQFRSAELYADLYENGSKPLVVIIGGSRAGIWSISPILADYLKENFNVLIFAYFGVPGLPGTLRNVPLEYFINGINRIKDMLKLKNEDITFIGNSKGAEATLLVVSKCFNNSNVVACVPSCYGWQGITKTWKDMFVIRPSWTYGGKDIPYIKMKFDTETILQLMKKSYCASYQKGIAENMNEAALIDLSYFKGKLLLLSAEKDNYWPSKAMCLTIMEKFNIDAVHKCLNQTGHYFQDYEEPVNETILFLKQNYNPANNL
jgi:hypothetical protein